MKARLQSIMLLRNDEQQIVANGYPYLRVDGKTTTYAAVPVIVDKSNDLAIIKINDSKFAPTSPVPYSFGIGTKDVGTTVFALTASLQAAAELANRTGAHSVKFTAASAP